MNLLEKLECIKRIDQLIRLKATGKPKEFAKRLKVSRSNLYYIIEFMKNQGAEIYYCSERESFCYEKEVYFYFGFFMEKTQLKGIKGGQQYFFEDFFRSPKFLDWGGVDL